MDSKKGISVIICCYNSAWVIDETLEYLFCQKINTDINWEILLINNASTDDTEQVVREACLKYNSENKIEIRVVFEAQAGLIYARNTGIRESKYKYILFCDDDNFLFEDYLQKAYGIMEADSSIGACGGKGIALMRECEEPAWFKQHQHSYAINTQKDRFSDEVLRLYGAGICIRKKALDDIKQYGFESLLTGRKGNQLLAGDDTELTSAIKIIGYNLYAADDLQFYHQILKRRLEIPYLLNMYTGFGVAEAVLFFYKRETSRLYNKVYNRKTLSENFYPMFLLLSFLRFVYYSKRSNLYNEWLYSYNKGIVKGAFMLFSKTLKVKKIIRRLLKRRIAPTC